MGKKVKAADIKQLRKFVEARQQRGLIKLGNSPTLDDYQKITALFWAQVGAGAGDKLLTGECVNWAVDRYSHNVWTNLPILLQNKIALGFALECCKTAGQEAAQNTPNNSPTLDFDAFKQGCENQEQGQQGLICG